MQLEWMGEYRDVVEKLIRYCNEYGSIYKRELFYGTKIRISYAQVQVIEYLLENEEKHQNMSTIANRLGVSLSAFSKLVNHLTEKGLLQKYHTDGNKKEIIIQVTDYGREIYDEYFKYILDTHFSKMFAVADKLPRETLPIVADMLDAGLHPTVKAKKKKDVLVPIDP